MNDAATCDKRWRAAGPRETSVSGTHHAPAASFFDVVGLPERASSLYHVDFFLKKKIRGSGLITLINTCFVESIA
jgi:hypothetical protein